LETPQQTQLDTINITPVILCGGSGTRLWPLSRAGFPKQFLSLSGKESLFQQAVARLSNLETQPIQTSPPIVVTGEEHRFLVSAQLQEINTVSRSILLEPIGRNTAPALTLAALTSTAHGEDAILVVSPADQTVSHIDIFQNAVKQAIDEALNDTVVVLGVTPDRPETGYGYIQIDKNQPQDGAYVVKQFVEKPDEKTAKSYLAQGGYYWNAGMFVLKASLWLNMLKQFRPDILEATQQAWLTKTTDQLFTRPNQTDFELVPAESIDYAVIEKCPQSAFPIKVVPLNAGWSDLGAWDAVWKVLPKDDQNNAHIGDVVLSDSQNNLVHANSRLVSLVGVKDLIVVETPDAVLVTHQSRSQDVKHIVNTLKQQKREEHVLHRKVHRPWGWYDSIDEGERFKVKRIQVNPKASLSLQKHHHRAEHWVVVRGTAEVTCGDKTIILTENQSFYIPLGEVHRLKNPGNMPLEIIEVQSGSYLGEDDIVRFEDSYGRN
jgi:mannose-1-phosphate guanylyltransferase/mannose-6-phosphate isomerase